MSRTFSKILIICAMVVIFPLLIVGTSLAAYYSISAIVEVDTYVNYTNVHADSNAFAGVLYNNKNEKYRRNARFYQLNPHRGSEAEGNEKSHLLRRY